MGFSFIWSESLDHVDKFHPNLSSLMKKQEKIGFLYVIKIKKRRITADLWYLHYNSCYADHIKRSIIFSKILQFRRICSKKNNNAHVKKTLKSGFIKRDILTIFWNNKWEGRFDIQMDVLQVMKIIAKKWMAYH